MINWFLLSIGFSVGISIQSTKTQFNLSHWDWISMGWIGSEKLYQSRPNGHSTNDQARPRLNHPVPGAMKRVRIRVWSLILREESKQCEEDNREVRVCSTWTIVIVSLMRWPIGESVDDFFVDAKVVTIFAYLLQWTDAIWLSLDYVLRRYIAVPLRENRTSIFSLNIEQVPLNWWQFKIEFVEGETDSLWSE